MYYFYLNVSPTIFSFKDRLKKEAEIKDKELQEEHDKGDSDTNPPIKSEPKDTVVKQEVILENLFDFDEQGLPIWKEKEIPAHAIPPRHDGFDEGTWKEKMNKDFSKMRKEKFDRVYASVKRKMDRKKQKEEAEAKVRAQQLKTEMDRAEKNAKSQLKLMLESSFSKLEIEITDDEEEGENADNNDDAAVTPFETMESDPFYSNEENCMNLGQSSVEQIIPMKTGMSLGAEYLGEDEIDRQSNHSFTSTPSTPRHSRRLAAQRSLDKMSAVDVQILTSPQLIPALEVFQGIKTGDESMTAILQDPRVLIALKGFHTTYVQTGDLTSTVSTEMYDPRIVSQMKTEDQPSAKRKLTDEDDFTNMWRGAPPLNKKNKKQKKHYVFTAGSDPREVESITDSSPESMRNMLKSSITTLREGDDLLSKNPAASSNISQKLVNEVSFSS